MLLSISCALRNRVTTVEVEGSSECVGAALRRPKWIIRAAALLVLFAATATAQPRGGPALSGVVVDPSGAVLPFAQVQLIDAAGQIIASTTTDHVGGFAFPEPAPGPYRVRVTMDGFEAQHVPVRVGSRPPKPVKVTLSLAAVHQEVTVTGGAAAQVTTSAAGNADTIAVTQQSLESLPVFDDDAVTAMSRFLDSSAIGNGGVSLLVNGMEVNSLNVSTEAIQQIKINQDPYSAAYSRPGRGRIDIITKPGSQAYHGSANVIRRDASLNARNVFADVKPPEQRRIADAFLGGPLGSGASTSFMASIKGDSEARQAVVFALGPQGDIRGNVAQPYSHLLATVGITHQHGASTMSIRPSYEEETNTKGAGGTTLGSAATTYYHQEIDLTYDQQTVIRPTLLNQFQILVGHEVEPTTSVSSAPGLVVNGAFTGGGAQVDLRRTELHFQLSENLAITKGAHFLQVGFQVPDWSRRGFYDRTGFGGTYYFASLNTYAAGQPYAFVQQRGNGGVVWLEKVLGAYATDNWQLGSRATLSIGLRYDWSNYFDDHDNLAPRFSIAVKPGDGDQTVLRGGAGLFYDKIGPFPVVDVLDFRPGGLQQVVLTNPAYPTPDPNALSETPPSVAQFAPGIQVPWTVQYSGGVERQLGKSATLSVMYYGSDATRLRSTDINAPPPPLYAARPNPAFGVIRQIDASARQRSDSLQVTLRGRLTRLFSGQATYAWSRTMNNSGGLNWYPANDYALSDEWARADFDRRHKLLLLGTLTPAPRWTVGVAMTLESGLPYSELLGTDAYNNGRGNARPPGVGRNTLEAAGSAVLDVRVAREFPLGGHGGARTVSVGLDAFNLLNAVNYLTYVGTVSSPFFGQPVTADAPRELQLSPRVKF